MRKIIAAPLFSFIAALTLSFLPGCPGSKAEKCPWGEVCHPGEVCYKPTEQCVLPDQISSCRDKDDYEPCDYRDSPLYSVCRNGICLVPSCGDSIIDPGEICDGTDLGGETCESIGYHEGGVLGCLSDCTGFDTSGCAGGYCGDGRVNGDEVCDGDDFGAESCQTQGFHEGNLVCHEDCTEFDASDCHGFCGDGIKNGPEVCDETEMGEETCLTQGFYAGTLACSDDCMEFDTSGCIGFCGDAVINGPEVCDGLNLGGATCESVGYYGGGALGCLDDCSGFDTSECQGGYCGDGEINGDEVCDGHDLGIETCLSVGMGYGELACMDDCSGFDTSDCVQWVSISSGDSHTCAVKSNGTAWCWGSNSHGQLGNGEDGTLIYETTPVQVLGLTDVSVISNGGSHTCAIKSDKTAWCWGDNFRGQLGDGTINNSNTPVQVVNLSDVSTISSGDSHTCAIKSDKTAWCWGINNTGQLGNGESGMLSYSQIPVQVVGLTDVSSISSGFYHTCAVKSDGMAWCWGWNNVGQLGNGKENFHEPERIPVQVIELTNVSAISTGSIHTCAVDNDGATWCWGSNQYSQLGDGTNDDSNTPVQVVNLTDVSSISNGNDHTCAVKNDETAWCWGLNSDGQLGDGTNDESNIPVLVVNLTNVSSISNGKNHTCSIRNDGTAWCWGLNTSGQLGDDTTENSTTPVEVVGQ